MDGMHCYPLLVIIFHKMCSVHAVSQNCMKKEFEYNVRVYINSNSCRDSF